MDTSGRRRSLRIAAAKPTPQAVQDHTDSALNSGEGEESEYEHEEKAAKFRPNVVVKRRSTEYAGNRLGKRKHNPCAIFGHVPLLTLTQPFKIAKLSVQSLGLRLEHGGKLGT